MLKNNKHAYLEACDAHWFESKYGLRSLDKHLIFGEIKRKELNHTVRFPMIEIWIIG